MFTERYGQLKKIEYPDLPEGVGPISAYFSHEFGEASDFPTPAEVEELIGRAFPSGTSKRLTTFVNRVIREFPETGLVEVLYCRSKEDKEKVGGELVALALVGRSAIGRLQKIGAFCFWRFVDGKEQGKGIGTLLARAALDRVAPDVLVSFTTNLPSYRSWEKAAHACHYEFWPVERPENDEARPSEVLSHELAERARQLVEEIWEVVGETNRGKDHVEAIDWETMVYRKFRPSSLVRGSDPWGGEDGIADYLKLTPEDAVVVVLTKS